MLDRLLKQLAEDLELEIFPTKQEDGEYLLRLYEPDTLFAKEVDEQIVIRGTIKECPSTNKEVEFMLLMKANLLFQGTGGAIIGLDANENFLTLFLNLPYDINYKTFKESLESFVNFLNYWKSR